MSEIKALSDAATQGAFHLNQPDGVSIYMRHDDGVRGRHIADTSRISSQAPKHVIDQDKANAKLICALVNKYRDGTLVDAKQARRDALQEAAQVARDQEDAIVQWVLKGHGNPVASEQCVQIASNITALMEADT